jgi:acetoin utilization protein AcuB
MLARIRLEIRLVCRRPVYVVETVAEVMTRTPHRVGDDQSVVEAALRMRELAVRHLPVMRGSRLVGIVSHRDLAVLEAISGAHPSELTVADAMTPDPYTVAPGTSLREVAAAMAEHKFGAVVVVEDGDPVGIFTTTDAVRLLAQR